jgi:hypothetical protein
LTPSIARQLAPTEMRSGFPPTQSLHVAGRNRAINPETLGKYLSKSTGRIVKLDDGALVRFEKHGARQGVVVWVLADVS